MDFAISGVTDIGIKKTTNQDSLFMCKFQTSFGEAVFSVLCDGMGGLEKGEAASASVITAFEKWPQENISFAVDNNGGINNDFVRSQWNDLIFSLNEKIRLFGRKNGVSLGTTITAIIISQKNYLIVNVGDTRDYAVTDSLYLLTKDQTLVAKEVEEGKLTEEQAENDPRRSILLQCVGASEKVYPEFFFGDVYPDEVFVLCTDGFRHEITAEEILNAFSPAVLCDEETMYSNSTYLIETNKARMERDNITVALIRSYLEG